MAVRRRFAPTYVTSRQAASSRFPDPSSRPAATSASRMRAISGSLILTSGGRTTARGGLFANLPPQGNGPSRGKLRPLGLDPYLCAIGQELARPDNPPVQKPFLPECCRYVVLLNATENRSEFVKF